jgi:hypothetical protein
MSCILECTKEDVPVVVSKLNGRGTDMPAGRDNRDWTNVENWLKPNIGPDAAAAHGGCVVEVDGAWAERAVEAELREDDGIRGGRGASCP